MRDPIPDRFGKYRVLRRIASGGMAQVYLCRLSGEGGFRKRVALKVVHPRHAEDPRFRELFAREARLAASLSHPNLIQVFDYGMEGDARFLAMEYVEGWNLAQAAAQARQLHVPIPPGVWRHWVEGLWSGLAYLHEKGIVHRDVSPSNVLVSRNGAVKITDFGISRGAGEARGIEGAHAGKSGYLSPERVLGDGATSSSDLFAAGVISVELLLGRRLFEGEDTEEILKRILRFDEATLAFTGVSPEAARVLRKSVAAASSDRFSTAGEFLAALAEVGPPQASIPERTDFWDALFPGTPEEETTPDPAAEPYPSMVKEREEGYGARGRKARAGAAAAFVAVVVGGVLLWKEAGERPAIDPGPVPAASAIPGAPALPDMSPAALPKRDVSRAGSPTPSPPRHPEPPAAPKEPVADLVRVETEPPGASVTLENGASVGKTPLQVDRASIAGRIIVISKDGYELLSVPADSFPAGRPFRAEMRPLTGTVEAIQAIPWAKVYLGNLLLGETPLTGVRLPAGEQRLRFVNEPLGVDKVETVVVRPGSNPKLIVPMANSGRR